MKPTELTKLYFFILFYAFFSIIFVVSTIYAPYPFSWILKTLPIALLVISVMFDLFQRFERRNILLLMALVFSGVGDFILDYMTTETGFILGLGAFFIAHVFFILRLLGWKPSVIGVVFSLLVIGYGVFVCLLILPKLGELKIPVLAYMTILLFMCLFALLNKEHHPLVYLGGIMFVVSDSLIGINKFHQEFNNSSVAIMSTYYLAQACLVLGLLNQPATAAPSET